jgi:glycosyltransferase
MQNRPLTIIVASYNDSRIVRTIKSIRDFDDQDKVSILVIDGGSDAAILELISSNLTEIDLLISEPDRGVFDALNKGLNACSSEYIGWLGADDFFSGNILATEVIAALQKTDLFVGSLYFFDGTRVTRKTSSIHCKYELAMNLGFHNPHYATFGRAEAFKKYRFELDNLGADIGYFIKVFKAANSVTISNKVATYQAEGGFSNRGIIKTLKVNFDLRKTFGLLFPIALIVKLTYKSSSKIFYKVFKKYVPGNLLQASEI